MENPFEVSDTEPASFWKAHVSTVGTRIPRGAFRGEARGSVLFRCGHSPFSARPARDEGLPPELRSCQLGPSPGTVGFLAVWGGNSFPWKIRALNMFLQAMLSL